MSGFNRFFEGLMIGGVMGFSCGLLSAPKPGSELRKQLVDESEDLYKQATESMHDIKSKTSEAIGNLQHKGEDLLKKASEKLPGKKEPVER